MFSFIFIEILLRRYSVRVISYRFDLSQIILQLTFVIVVFTFT